MGQAEDAMAALENEECDQIAKMFKMELNDIND